MYCILNDHSFVTTGSPIGDLGPLVKTLIDTFNKARSYKLEQLIAPHNFKDMPIAGGLSIKEYRNTLEDPDEKRRINSFIANSVQYFDSHYDKHFQSAEDGRLIELYHNKVEAPSMRDAHVCELPLLSLNVDPFKVPVIECEKYILTSTGDNSTPVKLPNLHQPSSVGEHHESLLALCQQIILKWKRWSPEDDPCWRKEVTEKIIADSGYPNYTGKESVQERRSNNMKVVEDVLKANGWIFDHQITKLNNHRNEIWKIYSNSLSKERIYISVDLGEGEFEISGRKGKWVNTTFFNGKKNEGKNYEGKGTHDIIVK